MRPVERLHARAGAHAAAVSLMTAEYGSVLEATPDTNTPQMTRSRAPKSALSRKQSHAAVA